MNVLVMPKRDLVYLGKAAPANVAVEVSADIADLWIGGKLADAAPANAKPGALLGGKPKGDEGGKS